MIGLGKLIWILYFGMMMVINALREIVFYGFQGVKPPVFSYFGYMFLFSALMLLPDAYDVWQEWKRR